MRASLIVSALLATIVGASSANAACAPAPVAGCNVASARHQSLMSYIETGKTDPDDIFTWVWHDGTDTQLSDFGNPLTDSYAFCVYDSSTRPQPLASEIANDPSGWKTSGDRLFYSVRADEDLRRLILRTKLNGHARILVHRDMTTVMHVLPFTTPVVVQLQISNGSCWEADYTSVRRNDAHSFMTQQ